MKRYIPISQPSLSEKELQLVTQAIKSTWISSTGSFIDIFEKKFAEMIGARFAITSSNGTTALHFALLALGIGPGDEVIIPALTFVASANVVTYTGATPVFVDVDQKTWNINPDLIEKKITKKTRAIMPVHLYGYPAQMDKILLLAKKYKLKMIEDAAEAHGASFNNRPVGSIGDIGCFSFYGNKIITTGEGGMIVTNNKKLANQVKLIKNHGMSPKKRYWHPVVGYNHRMTNVNAAIGVAQLTKFPEFLKKRDQIFIWYKTALESIPQITLPPESTPKVKGVNWLFTILFKTKNGKTRDGLMNYLKKNGIDSRPTFYPLNKFPMYKSKEKFPVSSNISKTGITLPTYADLAKKDVAYITDAITAYVRI